LINLVKFLSGSFGDFGGHCKCKQSGFRQKRII
jgi:hypothetical protein